MTWRGNTGRFIVRSSASLAFERRWPASAPAIYGSNLDNLSCVALFEGRASVAAEGEPEPLIKAPPELLQVCEEFGLILGTRP